MLHLPLLISDLAIILAVAGGVTLLFKKIGQPVVLGYLLAGLLVGPEVSFIPTVQDKEGIKIWAEIGVIVLLFGLGLEFSFRKLAEVGKSASITALTEIASMFGIGFVVGQIFGWNEMDSVFLGGILSISSTTIIIRAFDELGLRQRKFVSLVFGVLIVEDLIAILLMVILSTIAVSNAFSGMQLVTETLRLGFFLVLWFISGIFLVPGFLRKTRPLMNEETSLIVSLGLCLLMVVIATKVGFSPALGAFIMGSIFAETPDGEKIEHNLKPVRDLFAAVFFVSIGMLIELEAIRQHWLAILVISGVTIVGKFLSTCLGALISGQRLKHSVQAGMSLAQIGEFSFIIATLGLSLKVTSDFLYAIAVTVSAITTFTTPYLIRYADPFYSWIEKSIPEKWRTRLERDAIELTSFSPPGTSRAILIQLFLNSIIVIALGVAAPKFLLPLTQSILGSIDFSNYLTLGLTILLSLPFLWAILFRHFGFSTEPHNQEELQQSTSRATLFFLGKFILSLGLLAFLVSRFTSAFLSFLIATVFSIAVGLIGLRNFARLYQWLEARFLSHLNERERNRINTAPQKPVLSPWEGHLSEFSVHPDSRVVGKTLAELGLREKLGVSVALIARGSQHLVAPKGDVFLMAHDEISVIGTDEQLARLAPLLVPDREYQAPDNLQYGLECLLLDEKSPWVGKTIRESGVREATDGLIVGIERDGKRILHPDSLFELKPDDRVWIVGNKSLLIPFKLRLGS